MPKYPGFGALVEADFTGAATTWEAVGCLRDITPPPQVRTAVDATCLGDGQASTLPGIEEQSDFTFTEIWDPMEAVSGKIDTAYAGGTLTNWRITYTDGTTSVTIQFDGRVLALTPATTGADGVLEREVTVTRDGAIAYANPA